MTLADQVTGLCHDRKRSQPQEVHLEQAERIQDGHFELGDGLNRAFLGTASRPVQRQVFNDGFIGDDHPGCVGPRVPHYPLHLFGSVN